MIKKIPMRSCVVTKEKLPKKELIRIVRTPDSKIVIDIKGKVSGRGAYLKKDLEVIDKAKTSKVLEHHLEIKIDDDVYNEIVKIIKDEDNE